MRLRCCASATRSVNGHGRPCFNNRHGRSSAACSRPIASIFSMRRRRACDRRRGSRLGSCRDGVQTGGNDPGLDRRCEADARQSGRFIVLDVVRIRGTPHEVEVAIEEAARIDGTSVTIGLPEDPGQAGKHQASYLARRLAGYRVEYVA